MHVEMISGFIDEWDPIIAQEQGSDKGACLLAATQGGKSSLETLGGKAKLGESLLY